MKISEGVTLRSTDDNSIWLNIGLIICIIILIVILSTSIFIIYKYKRINVNQPSSTEQIELTENQGKSLPKIII